MSQMAKVKDEITIALQDLQQSAGLRPGQLLVVGCSTSEVQGERIGTAGTDEVAKALFDGFAAFQKAHGIELAYQCCEHINRALVVERQTAMSRQLEMVSVVPVRTAGGAMASYAYSHFRDPVVVEFIKADAGIDIGNTLIGMHIKHVAVPIRPSIKQIGQANVTMAKTRPKLIGGPRATYNKVNENHMCK